MKINYFTILCFAWALLGLLTRILILILGKKWNRWEENKAYSEKKPIWLYFTAILAVFLVGYTWYMVFATNVRQSWLIALLLTTILIKAFLQIFKYQKFKKYLKKVLNDPKLFRRINIVVTLFSLLLILLGLFYAEGKGS